MKKYLTKNSIDTEFIELLYMKVYYKNYTQAEKLLITFIRNVLKRNLYNTEQMALYKKTLNDIYVFNEKYIRWIISKGKDPAKEQEKHDTHEHKNFLIAHCFDPASMDDLLWELKHYLKNPADNKQKKEAQYHLSCYEKMIAPPSYQKCEHQALPALKHIGRDKHYPPHDSFTPQSAWQT